VRKLTLLHVVRRSLTHYWRTNAAVVVGVAVAVTVLAGALLVGVSVRGSLRDLVLQRLGRADLVVVSSDFFRARLADDLRADSSFKDSFIDVSPIVAVQGTAADQATGRRAARVQVYGVDDRFWQFHGRPSSFGATGDVSATAERQVLLSPALARDIGATSGSTVLLRVQRPSDIPIESLHGRKDDLGRTLRLTVSAVLAPADLGEFSLQPQQGEVRVAFVPLTRLQQEIGVGDRVNALLVSAIPAGESRGPALEALVRRRAALEDLGLTLRALDRQRELSLESDGALIDDPREAAALSAAEPLRLLPSPVFSYLANSIRSRDRSIPYSLVTAIELTTIVPDLESEEPSVPPIVLNEWAARDLSVRVDDRVTLEYYVWEDPGQLGTRTANFYVAAIVPISGAAADRDLVPVYPGITESETLRDWDPPFPIDLGLIRPVDEEYWRVYRTTPKAFVPLPAGRALWQSRYGSLTSIRFVPPAGTSLDEARQQYAERLRAAIDPVAMGLSVRDVRGEGLAASRGATDFGEYFTYFSFFLVVSAVMLAALFFKLGVEQRVREVGLLRAVGFTTQSVRRLFAAEALVLSAIGSAIGLFGAVGYGHLMMTGLRTWWVDAVGTTALTFHMSISSLMIGAVSGVIAALVCIWWTLRTLARVSERTLLSGQLALDDVQVAGPIKGRVGREKGGPDVNGSRGPERAALRTGLRAPGPLPVAIGLFALGVLLLMGGSAGWIGRSGAFFGAGASLLASCLFLLTFLLRKPPRSVLAGHGWWSVSRLGLRNASYRPARSVLAVAVMAAATFILISVEAFRRDDRITASDRRSGTGGYSLLVETMLPLAHDPNGAEGRELLGLADQDAVAVTPFRVLPGDDASCLNLYEPTQPKIVAVGRDFVAQGRFAFQSSLDRSDEELANPWLLLEREQRDEAIPVIADANSMTYVLHRELGDDIVFNHNGGRIRLRLVAALTDSIFQSELLMSEENFRKLFPEAEGYRLLLIDAPSARADEVAATVEDRLADFGADAVSTAERLAAFHKVENTYLSTFQTLGGLGLLLGTVGLAAVLLRNVLERRRELALLGAVGYGRTALFVIVIAESTLLLVCGLAIGAACALVAIAPAAADRGGRLPASAAAWLLLFAVFGTGLVSSIVATRAAIQSRLLDALRSE
jgi:putative ABC transport system permease protein